MHLFVRLPGRFDLHHRPRCTRWGHAHGLCLLRRHGQREGSAHLYGDFHHLSEPLRRSRDYAGVIRVQHTPHRTTNVVHSRLRSHRRRRFLQVHQLGEDGRFLTESLENISQYGCEENVEQQRGLRQGLHLEPIRTDAVIRSHTSSHPIVELLDDCYHLRWYSDASEYLPQEGAVNGVVRLLEVYKAHEEGHSCLPPNFLQPAHHKHHVRGRAVRSEPALLLR